MPFPWTQDVVTLTSVSSLESESSKDTQKDAESYNRECEQEKEGTGKKFAEESEM